uniref:Uncharacterized protein STRF2 n=1 Tax=Homo sapiens TaxID=9606 RepID=Q6EHZ2_HUMAN|nr:putative protein STRF2 [Homo sapiens]
MGQGQQAMCHEALSHIWVPGFDLKRWLLYTFCNWFDVTFQLQLCILRTLKRFCRSILYNLKDRKTFWLPQAYLSFLLIQ